MKNCIKLKVIILVLSLFFTYQTIADQILPIKKPNVDQETKVTTAKNKEIYPQKKPLKKVITTTNEIIEQSNETSVDNSEIASNIYPQKKPITYKEPEKKAVDKSQILSKKDFKIAKSIFANIKKKKWGTALKLSEKANDKNLYKLINYIYLIKHSNGASFSDYANFINKNPNYPRIGRLRYLAEHKINLKQNKPKKIIKWFDGSEPLSEFGKIKLGEIHLLKGNIDEGSKLIKEGWIKAKLTKSELAFLRKKYKKIITVSDNIKRADWHAWEGKYWDLQRMLRYLPKDETALYRARQLLMSKSYGVDTAIRKVPEKFKNDIGLKYDRLKWRRRRGRLEGSLEILFKLPNKAIKLVRPDIWWEERRILSRSLIYKKNYVKAYKVASNHSLSEGPEYANAEWLSGWIALTFLNDPNLSIQHFMNFYNNVGYPISLARGAYRLGRSYKEINNKQKSEQ